MLENDPIYQVSDLLKAEHFYVDAHKEVYKAIMAVYVKGHPVDILTVTQELKAMGVIDIVGGPFYISKLTNGVASAAHVLRHAQIILEKFMLREVIRIGTTSTAVAYDNTTDCFELLDELAREHTDLHNIVTPREVIASDNIGALIDDTKPDYLTFGIEALDRDCVMERGLVHTFAGRPGMGKSILSTHIAWHLTQFGSPILFSPEMVVRQVQARIVSMESGIPYMRILQRKLTEEDISIIGPVINAIADRLARLKVDPTSAVTPLAVRARSERAMKTGGVVGILMDYIQKMTTGDKQVDRDDTKRVGACSAGFTDTCKALHIPGVVFSQLNREVEKRPDKRPKMSDMRDSGTLEQDAAMVGLLYRPGYYEEEQPVTGDFFINIAKYRDGVVGQKHTSINIALNRIGDYHVAQPRPAATVPVPHPDQQHAQRTETDDLPF